MKDRLAIILGIAVLFSASCTNPKPRIRNSEVPLSFEENRGQVDSAVRFLARSHAYTIFLTPEEAVVVPNGGSSQAVRLRFANAGRPRISAIDPLERRSNFLIGNDSSRWQKDVPHFSRVLYENIYPDTDVVYYGDHGQLRYDLVLRPGARPDAIRFSVDGAEQLAVRDGNLLIFTSSGEFRLDRPVIYQDIGGERHEIAGQYRIEAGNSVAFDVAPFDRSQPLVIDPTLTYSTFLGGAGEELVRAITVDAGGNAYVVGTTTAADFPTTPGALQSARANNSRPFTFVTKLNAAGSGLVYSTYIAPTNPEANIFIGATSIAVDGEGNAYLTGAATVGALPTTAGAFQRTSAGSGSRAFVLKLSATGSSIVYSTYLGGTGNGNDRGNVIIVDSAGNAYVAGETGSADFPTSPGSAQPAFGSGYNPKDAFVVKLNPAGSALVFSTFLGGRFDDKASQVAIDPVGNVYVAGTTVSSDFPITPDAFQIARGGSSLANEDAFLTKLNPNGTALLYSTYLGGNGGNSPLGLEVDALGNATLVGTTGSPDFPTTPGAYRTSNQAAAGAGFLTKFNATGTGLLYSTRLPVFFRAGTDTAGRFYFIGPEIFAFDPSTSSILYTTKLAGFTGDGETSPSAIAVDSGGNAYIAGHTQSSGFPTTPGSYQTELKVAPARRDAFIVKISPARAAPVITSLSPASTIPGSAPRGLTLIVRGLNFEPGSVVSWNGVPRMTTYVTIAELKASIPATELAASGTAEITVQTPDVGTSNSLVFSILTNPVPAVTALGPSRVEAGKPGFVMGVTGTGFLPTSVVRFNGTNRGTNFVSDTRLNTFVPDSYLASPGTVEVSVFNPEPGGGLSNSMILTVTDRVTPPPPSVDVPTLAELMPASTPAGSGPFGMQARGSGFVSGRSTAFWGKTRLETGVQSPTMLQVNIPQSLVASEGDAEITVVNTPPGGGTSNPLIFRVTSRLPKPVIQSLSQTSAAAGSAGFTLSINGDILDGAKVQWNGQERPATLVRSSGTFAELRVSISAGDLAQPGLAYITVWNPGPGGGTSASVTFTIYESRVLDIATSDLLHDPSRGKFFATRPAVSRSDRNSISQIDPETGTVERSVVVGNEPASLSASDNYGTLYVVLDQGRQVRRVDLANFAAGGQFALDPPLVVEDIKVLPGTANSVAVALKNPGMSGGQGVVIYDDGIKRSRQVPPPAPLMSIGFSKSGRLFGCSTGVQPGAMYALTIEASGVSLDSTTQSLCGEKFESGNGMFYTASGSVVDPEARAELGRHPLHANDVSVRPDPTTGKTFYLAYNGTMKVATIFVFDESTFTLTGSLDVQGVGGIPSSPVRFGSNGIAFRTDSQVFFVRLPGELMATSYTTNFSQFANGGGYTSSIIITNPSASEVARGSINLFGDGGLPFYAPADFPKISAIPFTIPPLGSATFTPLPADSRVATGSVRISSNIPVSAVVRFEAAGLGIAGVGQSASLSAMIVPVVRDSARRLNTGVALSNPQTESVDVTLTLRALDGSEVVGASKTERLPPNGHLARFIDELFPSLQLPDFQGTMTIRAATAGKKIAAVGLQLGATPGEFTAMPVVSTDSSHGPVELLFPQFATGGGISSSIFLVNPSDTSSRGTMRLYDDAGTPLTSNIAGVNASEFQFTVLPGGGAVFTSGDSGQTVTGWARVASDSAAGGALRFSAPGLGIAGVGAGAPSKGFISPVSRSEAANISTGVAIISTESTVTLSLTLRDRGGSVLPNGSATITLPANGHVSRFIQELFPEADTREFEGTLTVTSDQGPVAGIAIQLGTRPGEFTTLPVQPIR